MRKRTPPISVSTGRSEGSGIDSHGVGPSDCASRRGGGGAGRRSFGRRRFSRRAARRVPPTRRRAPRRRGRRRSLRGSRLGVRCNGRLARACGRRDCVRARRRRDRGHIRRVRSEPAQQGEIPPIGVEAIGVGRSASRQDSAGGGQGAAAPGPGPRRAVEQSPAAPRRMQLARARAEREPEPQQIALGRREPRGARLGRRVQRGSAGSAVGAARALHRRGGGPGRSGRDRRRAARPCTRATARARRCAVGSSIRLTNSAARPASPEWTTRGNRFGCVLPRAHRPALVVVQDGAPPPPGRAPRRRTSRWRGTRAARRDPQRPPPGPTRGRPRARGRQPCAAARRAPPARRRHARAAIGRTRIAPGGSARGAARRRRARARSQARADGVCAAVADARAPHGNPLRGRKAHAQRIKPPRAAPPGPPAARFAPAPAGLSSVRWKPPPETGCSAAVVAAAPAAPIEVRLPRPPAAR